MGNLEHNEQMKKPIQNPFEIVHKFDLKKGGISGSTAEPEDFFIETNEGDYKKIEEMSRRKIIDKEIPNITQGNKAQSNLMEWVKILQKSFNQEKSSINGTESKNILLKAYKTILNQKDRHWYEEMTQLYKVRS